MSRTVRRFCLVDALNFDHIEGWLEAMARKGLFFDHTSPWFFHFQPGEPRAVRYRVEPGGTLDNAEGMAYCQSLGWELAGKLGPQLFLYRSDDPEAPELHTDPVVRGYGLDKLARQMRWRYLVVLLCMAGMLVSAIWPLTWDEPVLALIGSSNTLYLGLLMEFIAIYLSIRYFSSFFALRRRLKAGEGPRRSGWRRSARATAAALACSCCLLVLSLVQSAAYFLASWESETAAAERPFPILELRELEDNPALEAIPSPIALEIFGYDRDNSVRYDWSWLCPGQYEVDQRLTDGGDYEPRLDMRWYRLSLPCLASPLLDDLISRYSDFRYAPEHYTVTEPELPGFDRAVLVQNNRWPGQELFLQARNVVIYLDYSGAQELTGRPDLLTELAAWRPSAS